MSKDDGGVGALKAGLAAFSRLFDHRAIMQGTKYVDVEYNRSFITVVQSYLAGGIPGCKSAVSYHISGF